MAQNHALQQEMTKLNQNPPDFPLFPYKWFGDQENEQIVR
jgi:hypothetical protein